jgi:hypothetical protein
MTLIQLLLIRPRRSSRSRSRRAGWMARSSDHPWTPLSAGTTGAGRSSRASRLRAGLTGGLSAEATVGGLTGAGRTIPVGETDAATLPSDRSNANGLTPLGNNDRGTGSPTAARWKRAQCRQPASVSQYASRQPRRLSFKKGKSGQCARCVQVTMPPAMDATPRATANWLSTGPYCACADRTSTIREIYPWHAMPRQHEGLRLSWAMFSGAPPIASRCTMPPNNSW